MLYIGYDPYADAFRIGDTWFVFWAEHNKKPWMMRFNFDMELRIGWIRHINIICNYCIFITLTYSNIVWVYEESVWKTKPVVSRPPEMMTKSGVKSAMARLDYSSNLDSQTWKDTRFAWINWLDGLNIWIVSCFPKKKRTCSSRKNELTCSSLSLLLTVLFTKPLLLVAPLPITSSYNG